MSKVEKLLKSINLFVSKVEEDGEEKLIDIVPDFSGLEIIPDMVEEYEKKIAKLLRSQRKRFLQGIKGFTSKDEKETLEALLQYFFNDLFIADEFVDEFSDETADFLQMTIEELCKQLMESIDKDVAFETLSSKSIKWIEDWSSKLAEIMKLNTHKAVEDLLKEGIKNGDSIQQIEMKMKDLPQFDRTRARTTAITEILTASSRAQWESYMQSPAVTGKKWKHSGSKKNNPRQNHVDLDGTIVGVDEVFVIPGSGESCYYPRDPLLPPSERVNCHCALGPVVDEDIIGLSKEEKEKLRQEALEELNA
ncbi:phage minor head protein [Heyndrickxia sporothermodurans]